VAPPLAGVLRRWAALVYEALLLVALVFIASFVLAPLVSPGSATRGELVLPSRAARIGSFVALFTLGAVYFAWIWSEGRRTLPMKAWRLALVTQAFAPVSRRQALARYVAAWIGPALAVVAYGLLEPHGFAALAWPLVFVNWLAALVDPQQQFLHDRIAGTRLVTTTPAADRGGPVGN
jgi:uncharacterized RDD family membrane protein YckC